MTKQTTLLNNKVVIVTGGSAGCGWGFTLSCLKAGANVIVADLNPLSDDKQAILDEHSYSVDYVKTDVSSSSSIEQLVEQAKALHGRIDGLVNNAGLTITGDFMAFDLDTVDRLYKTNLRSVFLMSQTVAKVMIEQGGGVIVNVASNHAQASAAEYEMYAATKGGICAMTRAMSWSLGKHGIRVNSLCPGLTRTEPIDEMVKNDPTLEQTFNALHATRTFNSVEQLGQVGVFLLSDMSASMTGTEVVADQGLLAGLVNSDVLS